MGSLTKKKLFLFDIDGTLSVGNTLYEGSRELLSYIDSIGGRSYFITNNSTRSSMDYVRKFRESFQLETSEEQFITSGFMTLRFLKEHFSSGGGNRNSHVSRNIHGSGNRRNKIFVLGTSSFIEDLRQNGLEITEEAEDEVCCAVAAYDSELTYEKLVRICKVLSTAQVPFYATNPDLCCPVDFGFIPDCGAICEMITSSTGRKPIYLGKPNKEIVELCLADSGLSKEETLVVGDRLYTDIACGINAGVDTCVVFTGEAKPEDLADTPHRPDYEFETIMDLYRGVKQ